MKALQATIRAINVHGVLMDYASIASTYDPSTTRTTLVKTSTNLKMYPKQVIADHYRYSAWIGKEVVLFYLANNSLSFTPKIADEITYKSKTYKVVALQEHFAYGEIALYRITAVKG